MSNDSCNSDTNSVPVAAYDLKAVLIQREGEED